MRWPHRASPVGCAGDDPLSPYASAPFGYDAAAPSSHDAPALRAPGEPVADGAAEGTARGARGGSERGRVWGWTPIVGEAGLSAKGRIGAGRIAKGAAFRQARSTGSRAGGR